jgi:hypothetical protein
MSPSPTPPRVWLALIAIAAAGILAGVALTITATHTAHPARRAQRNATRRPIVQGGSPATPRSVRAPTPAPDALHTAQAFAGAYVAFLYGQQSSSSLPYASAALRARLEQLHPQLPAAVAAAASPQLTNVQVTPTGPAAATATAVIEDGQAIDPITLTLTQHAGAWTVGDLTENG